jgi:hypothetical protein
MSARINVDETLALLFGVQFLLSDWEIGKPFASAITKIDRRLLCINNAAPVYKGKHTIFELTHMLEAASCRPYCLNDWQV